MIYSAPDSGSCESLVEGQEDLLQEDKAVMRNEKREEKREEKLQDITKNIGGGI